MNLNMKIRLIFGIALLSLSISTASAEVSMRSDYRKSDVQPVKVAKVIRPGFPRHLKAMENGRFGGVYEQQ
ncbi:hypothetical protein VDR43_23625, partial [Xanthomonas campestris pv. campestris]|nr:hypothetical protein [Xanthomonas campestris pv. campestris]